MVCESVPTIDYRSEDGRCPVSASCGTVSNPDSLSSSKIKGQFWNKIELKKLFALIWDRCQSDELGLYSLHGLECDNFKPHLKSDILNTCSAWTVFIYLFIYLLIFVGDDQGFRKEGVKSYIIAPLLPFSSPNSVNYSLCWIRRLHAHSECGWKTIVFRKEGKHRLFWSYD